MLKRITFVLLVSGVCWAQRYEVGADVGYGWYRSGTILSNSGNAKAGVRNRFVAGVILGYEFSRYVSLEFNYLYHDGHPFLEAQGASSEIQGQSHTLTPELLFHFKKLDHRWRPFLEGGFGAKGYITAGPAPFPQPFPQIATLSTNDVWKTVFSFGGGTKYRFRDHVLLRGTLLDYVTTFPRHQIVPAPNNTARGMFNQLTLLFGASYTF